MQRVNSKQQKVKELYRYYLTRLNEFKNVAISPEEALLEYYCYRVLAFIVLGLGILVTIGWGITVIPNSWIGLWLAFVLVSFGLVLILAVKQLHHGNIQYKLQLELKESSKGLSRQKRLLLSLIGIFILSLIFNLWISSLRVQWLIGDSGYYYRTGRQIVTSYTPDPVRPSGYTVLISYFIRLFGSDFFGHIYLFQTFINSLNALLVYATTRLIFRQRAIAWVATLLCAFCPFTAGYNGALLTETMAIFFMTTTVYLTVLVVTRPNIKLYYVLLGLSAILLLEIRYNFQLYVAVPFILIMLFTPLHLKVKLQNVALVVLMTLLILAPAVLANYNTFHKIIIFTKADNFSYSLMLATYYNHGHWFTDLADPDKTLTLIGNKYPYATSYLECEWSNCPENELGL